MVGVLTGTIPGDSANFFGLVSDTAFTTVQLVNPAAGTTDGIGIDDMTVSAPPAAVLLLSGLASLVGYKARRSRS